MQGRFGKQRGCNFNKDAEIEGMWPQVKEELERPNARADARATSGKVAPLTC